MTSFLAHSRVGTSPCTYKVSHASMQQVWTHTPTHWSSVVCWSTRTRYTFVCVCVYMHVCVCTCVYVYLCMHVCACVCTPSAINTCLWLDVSVALCSKENRKLHTPYQVQGKFHSSLCNSFDCWTMFRLYVPPPPPPLPPG